MDEEQLLELLQQAWALVITTKTDDRDWLRDSEKWRRKVQPLIENRR